MATLQFGFCCYSGLVRTVALVCSVSFTWFGQVCRGSFPLQSQVRRFLVLLASGCSNSFAGKSSFCQGVLPAHFCDGQFFLSWRFGQARSICKLFLSVPAVALGFAVRVVLSGVLAASSRFAVVWVCQAWRFSAVFSSVHFLRCLRFASLAKSSHRWVWCLSRIGVNRSVRVGGGWALAAIAWPNKSVKGTRRPVAVLKVWFFSRFGCFVSLSLAARPLP